VTLSLAKVAIVGATGPTGIQLAAALRAAGHGVRAIGRNPASLARLFPDDAVEKVPADAREAGAIARAIEGCELAVDCIGLPAGAMGEHAVTAAAIAEALRLTGARGLQISSYWAYMPFRRLPVEESHPREGGNAYIRARRAAEDILAEAGAAIVHLPDFFGPFVHISMLQQPLADAAAGRAMNWVGPRKLEREYVFVPDAMRLVAALARRPEAYGQHWALPGAGPLSGGEAAAIASAHLGRPVRLRAAGSLLLRLVGLFNPDLRDFLPMLPHYLKPMRYDGGKLARLLGPLALTPYTAAIPQTLDWLMESGGGKIAQRR
jgi:nucleoside-diphosphate-sugar epimerase